MEKPKIKLAQNKYESNSKGNEKILPFLASLIMEEVKHVLLVKFKDGVSEEQIEQLVKDYANLVKLIEPMKSFKW